MCFHSHLAFNYVFGSLKFPDKNMITHTHKKNPAFLLTPFAKAIFSHILMWRI